MVLKIVEGQEAGGGSEGRCDGVEDAAEERMEGRRRILSRSSSSSSTSVVVVEL